MSERIVGKGVEKTVYEDPNNPDRVIKVYHHESTSLPEVKARYHFGKLLHILFPDNIPDMFQAGQKDGETSIIAAERRDLDPDHVRISELLNRPGMLSPEEREEYDTIRIRQEKSDLGYDIVRKLESLGVGFDTQARNFSHQESGHDVYLDTINPWKFLRPTDGNGQPDLSQKKYLALNFDETGIIAHIEALGDALQKRQAYMHLERIKALAEQEEEEKNSIAWGPF